MRLRESPRSLHEDQSHSTHSDPDRHSSTHLQLIPLIPAQPIIPRPIDRCYGKILNCLEISSPLSESPQLHRQPSITAHAWPNHLTVACSFHCHSPRLVGTSTIAHLRTLSIACIGFKSLCVGYLGISSGWTSGIHTSHGRLQPPSTSD